MKNCSNAPFDIQLLIDAQVISVTHTSDEVVFSVTDEAYWPDIVEYMSENVTAISAQENCSVRLVSPTGESTTWPYRPSLRGAAAARSRSLESLRRLLGPHGPHAGDG